MGRFLTLALLFTFSLVANGQVLFDGEIKDPPPGWIAFDVAITSLRTADDRAEPAKLFRAVHDKYPDSQYAAVSKELADQLDKMVDEDIAWNKGPAKEDLAQSAQNARIRSDIYHLRDVRCVQWSLPAECSLLSNSDWYPNTAINLLEVGQPAIPALIELLNDRRPTRSVSFGRRFGPSYVILRNQDAAMEILNRLLPVQFYQKTYFSIATLPEREKVIASVNRWYQSAKDKDPLEQKWLAVREVEIRDAIELIKSLALQDGQKERALKELHWLYAGAKRECEPTIATIMADLGDESKVSEVIFNQDDGKYRLSSTVPDDTQANWRANDVARRLRDRFGARSTTKP